MVLLHWGLERIEQRLHLRPDGGRHRCGLRYKSSKQRLKLGRGPYREGIVLRQGEKTIDRGFCLAIGMIALGCLNLLDPFLQASLMGDEDRKSGVSGKSVSVRLNS